MLTDFNCHLIAGTQLHIINLPDHVLINVFYYLSLEDLCLSARLVCQHWNFLTYDLTLWKVLDLTSKVNSVTDDVFLDILGKVQNYVEHINLRELKLTDKALRHENIFCPKLKHLDISRTEITDKTLDYLVEKYRDLESLLCFKCKNLEQSYQCFAKLKNLRRFYDPYEDCMSRPEDLCLEIHDIISSKITEVRFTCVELTEEIFVEVCRKCPDLERIQIPECIAICDEGIVAACEHMKHVTSLDISRLPGVTDKGLKVIGESCEKLQEVNVSECRLITDIGISDFVAVAKNLKILVLNEDRAIYGNITDVGLLDISERCYNLQELVLCSCPSVTDIGIQFLASNCHELQLLDIAGCLAVTDSAIYAVAEGCPKLQKLSASECVKLTAKSINYLIDKCKYLNQLELQTCMYLNKLHFSKSATARNRICLPIPENDSMLSNNSKRDDTHSKDGKTTVCQLMMMDLSFCSKLTTFSVQQIAKYCTHLTFLSLRGCYLINDNAIVAIAKNCHVLGALDIAGGSILQTSCITDTALAAIAKHCNMLEFLSIDKVQRITLEGITILAMECCPLYRIHVTTGGRSQLNLKQVSEMFKQFRRKCWVSGFNEKILSDKHVGDFILKFLPIRQKEMWRMDDELEDDLLFLD